MESERHVSAAFWSNRAVPLLVRAMQCRAAQGSDTSTALVTTATRVASGASNPCVSFVAVHDSRADLLITDAPTIVATTRSRRRDQSPRGWNGACFRKTLSCPRPMSCN